MGKSRIQDFLVYDVETGGLPSKTNMAFYNIALTEVALVYVSPGLEILGKTSFLLRPYGGDLIYHPKASEVSGITVDLLNKEGITLEEGFTIIKDFITSYQTSKTKPRLVGHNIKSFDNQFLENYFEFMGSDLYKFVQKESEDTLEWCHRIFDEAPDYKLGTMCDQFDVELTDAHRALPDTIANAELFIKMLKNLRGLNVATASDNSLGDNVDIIDKINKFQF